MAARWERSDDAIISTQGGGQLNAKRPRAGSHTLSEGTDRDGMLFNSAVTLGGPVGARAGHCTKRLPAPHVPFGRVPT